MQRSSGVLTISQGGQAMFFSMIMADFFLGKGNGRMSLPLIRHCNEDSDSNEDLNVKQTRVQKSNRKNESEQETDTDTATGRLDPVATVDNVYEHPVSGDDGRGRDTSSDQFHQRVSSSAIVLSHADSVDWLDDDDDVADDDDDDDDVVAIDDDDDLIDDDVLYDSHDSETASVSSTCSKTNSKQRR